MALSFITVNLPANTQESAPIDIGLNATPIGIYWPRNNWEANGPDGNPNPVIFSVSPDGNVWWKFDGAALEVKPFEYQTLPSELKGARFIKLRITTSAVNSPTTFILAVR
jgi:hypothetical protein